jgi:hypothetical protein
MANGSQEAILNLEVILTGGEGEASQSLMMFTAHHNRANCETKQKKEK